MDNASIHNNNVISIILARKNITLVKLRPYSYDLNSIEFVFGLAKSFPRRNPGYLSDDMVQAIADVFFMVTPHQVKQFYRKSWALINEQQNLTANSFKSGTLCPSGFYEFTG